MLVHGPLPAWKCVETSSYPHPARGWALPSQSYFAEYFGVSSWQKPLALALFASEPLFTARILPKSSLGVAGIIRSTSPQCCRFCSFRPPSPPATPSCAKDPAAANWLAELFTDAGCRTASSVSCAATRRLSDVVLWNVVWRRPIAPELQPKRALISLLIALRPVSNACNSPMLRRASMLSPSSGRVAINSRTTARPRDVASIIRTR